MLLVIWGVVAIDHTDRQKRSAASIATQAAGDPVLVTMPYRVTVYGETSGAVQVLKPVEGVAE